MFMRNPRTQPSRSANGRSSAIGGTGFTLIELLVVISIIALLISLLLPALARAKSLALQIECASNMQQIGVAMTEYADEYRGMYPPTYTPNYPFGVFDSFGTSAGWTNFPTWGFGLLYYSSFGTNGLQMLNPQPGILPPTPQGVSLMFSTQPGSFSQQRWVPASDYNTNGILDNWSNLCSGYDYWVDHGKDWVPSEDMAFVQYNQRGIAYSPTWSGYNYFPDYYDTEHVPAANPRSKPGSILVTDQVFFQGRVGTYGLTDSVGTGGNGPVSDHVTSASMNALPEGAHELYNDGAVVWVPGSQLKVREFQGYYMGW
ncbi:MAG: type II secretion system protein [Phycisphaerae bacterium]